MSELSELYGESANNTKIEEHLEESSISQDDYKKLRQENECYRQELYMLRLKLETGDALKRDLQESNETLEKQLTQYATKVETTLAQREEKYRAEKKEYESHIADLETSKVKNEQEIKELQKELKKYKNLVNERPFYLTSMEDTLTPYREKIEELTMLLQNEEKKGKYLEEKLANMEAQYHELKDILKITKDQLVEKNEALEDARESARELTASLNELQSSKITPASDTCKGNSLFAEVEDRRQMLLDKMKTLSNKYNEAKRALNTKMTEIKLLRAEKIAMTRKWEIDAIDTLQENADLLNNYKSRIFDLESKLKAEMKRNDQVEKIEFTDDSHSFNYAQSLLAAKGKTLKELNEKIEKQAMQMLVQQETNHNILIQLRYWRSKAMSLEAQILAIKAQLETEQTNDNKTLLESIENCKISSNVNFEKICDDSKLSSDKLMLEDDVCQGNSTQASKEPVIDFANEQIKPIKKFVFFDTDTKDTESKSLKKRVKQPNYQRRSNDCCVLRNISAELLASFLFFLHIGEKRKKNEQCKKFN